MTDDSRTEKQDASATPAQPTRAGRRWAFLILMIAAAVQLSRILQVQSSTGEVPFLSANDRSRWCTIATLVVNGSYQIDPVLEIRDPKTKRRVWYTIDLVRHRSSDGKQHFFSSKPPLLPTLYAGVYWMLRAVTGVTLMNDPFFVARILLVIVNLIPLVMFWCLLLRWFEKMQLGEWAMGVMALFVCGGTYLSTFANTLNNHLPAAIATGISLWCMDRIALRHDARTRWFLLCGLCTSFAAANELPALGWLCAAGVFLGIVDFKRTVFAYVPALVPVALAFFGCNYLAHGELAPAYAHRNAGVKLMDLDWIIRSDATDAEVDRLEAALREKGHEVSDQCTLRPARRPNTLELWDAVHEMRYALRIAPDGNSSGTSVHRWGDWYDYEGSYWKSEKQGVDRGEPSRATYVFHCLLGHHGIFSLTPFWAVAVAGVFTVWSRRTSWNCFQDHRLLLTAALVATTVVVIGFYFARGLEDRNYGGVSSGFRWTFWMIPLWLWLSAHALKRVESRGIQRCVELLVVASIFTASWPWRNPWTSPWPMQWMEAMGWL